jgi:ABC-2 type transport system ATP-binding protein
LISSHILSDIESTCSYVVILNKGKLAAHGKISELKQINFCLFELKVKGESENFFNKLKNLDCQLNETEDGMLKIYMPPQISPQEIFRIGAEENIQIRHFVRSESSLEDLFANVVGVD